MNNVLQPVFFIGVPRSGTTLLFEAFAKHESLGWPSNYNDRFPRIPQFGLIMRLMDNSFLQLTGEKKQYNPVFIGNTFLPRPAEAYNFWNFYTQIAFSRNYLINSAASAECAQRVRNAVNTILFWEGKQRFSAKLTGPSRIYFLKSIFPDAKFIHVIRDGRAVVHSMLNTISWTTGNFFAKPWWNGALDDTDLEKWLSHNKDPAILAAIQWKKIIEIARVESLHCAKQSYIEIKYEDFINRPHDLINQLYKWCELPDSDRTRQHLDKMENLYNMNDKYKKHMSVDKIRIITETLEPMLNILNYT